MIADTDVSRLAATRLIRFRRPLGRLSVTFWVSFTKTSVARKHVTLGEPESLQHCSWDDRYLDETSA